MSKRVVGPVSGFPEWLPEERAVELEWLDKIRKVYESYGYASLETRSVELIPVLLKQGDTDKEIYGIHRLANDQQAHDEAGLALHYDLTVPFARYTAQNLNALTFPFKRYQMQKVWRGERPQGGRFREFYQCDIDVVDRNNVALFYDYEVATAALEALSALDLGPLKFRANNRKILEGFYLGLGIHDTTHVLRIMDRIEKVGEDNVAKLLREEMGLSDSAIGKCIALSKISGPDSSIVRRVRTLGVSHPMLDEGLDELVGLRANLTDLPTNVRVELDLSITRGLAYYTGNVFETELERSDIKASVCSGGRYENLVGDMTHTKLPGVGISIGLSRVMSIMQAAKLLPEKPASPTQVMVAQTPGVTQEMQIAASKMLRGRGLRVEVYPGPVRLSNQLRYASRKSIPFVYFIGTDGAGDEVKEMASGQQFPVIKNSWDPT